MKDYLNNLPKPVQNLIHKAAAIASSKGMPIYLVGGFVRDLLLGVKNLDLDIVVEGDGIAFAEELCRVLGARLVRHSRFRTATIIPKQLCDIEDEDKRTGMCQHLKIDITSARKETYPEPAHLPVVEPGSLKEDLFRRDFTINAMAISIGDGNFGQLIDFFGGRIDLKNKKIRFLHELSFIDDPTRILRAVRFEQRYGFRIEPETLKYLKAAARDAMLEKVEPHRIRDDLILVLKEENPLKELKRLKELLRFNFISPRLGVSGKTYELMKSVAAQVSWFRKNFAQRRFLDRWLMYFMALTDSLDYKAVCGLCRRLALRKGEEKRISSYKKITRPFIARIKKKEIRPSVLFHLLEPLSYEVLLTIKAKFKDKVIKKRVEEFLKSYNGVRIHISGEDLHRLGVAPGPCYQKLFALVLNAKLDGQVKTKEEELELVKKLL